MKLDDEPEDDKPKVASTSALKKASKKPTPFDANDLLGRVHQVEAKREIAYRDKDQEKYQYYMRCSTCRQPGIFFTRFPLEDELKSKDWFSTYKAVEETYTARDVLCQVCLQELDKEVPLQVHVLNTRMTGETRFRIRHRNQRHVYRVAKGDVTGFDPEPVTNIGIAQVVTND